MPFRQKRLERYVWHITAGELARMDQAGLRATTVRSLYSADACAPKSCIATSAGNDAGEWN